MRWFKMMSDNLDDPFIQDLLYEFGSDGYLVFFGVISLIAKENKKNVTGKASFSAHFLKQKFHISATKVRQILDFCQTKGKLFFRFCGKNFDLDFPKIKEIKDNHSNRYVVTTKQEVEVEVEVDKDKTLMPVPEKPEPGVCVVVEKNFSEDYAAYPRKAGNKKKTLACYKKTVGSSDEKRQRFRKKMAAYIASVHDPTFLLYAETFFRNWVDLEITEPVKPNEDEPKDPPEPLPIIAFFEPTNEDVATWEACLGELETRVRPDNFEAALKPLAIAKTNCETAVIVAPNQAVGQCVVENYLTVIEEVLQKKVQIVVRETP